MTYKIIPILQRQDGSLSIQTSNLKITQGDYDEYQFSFSSNSDVDSNTYVRIGFKRSDGQTTGYLEMTRTNSRQFYLNTKNRWFTNVAGNLYITIQKYSTTTENVISIINSSSATLTISPVANFNPIEDIIPSDYIIWKPEVEERLDDLETEIDTKVDKTQTIAGVDLQDNITKQELLTALNVEDGAEVNVVTKIQRNGVDITPTGTVWNVNDIPDYVQYETVPTASSEYNNKIIQYVGTTDSTYTNGYFYKCSGQSVEESIVATQIDNVVPLGTITINNNEFKSKLGVGTHEFKVGGYPTKAVFMNISAFPPVTISITRDSTFDRVPMIQGASGMYSWVDDANNFYVTDTKNPKGSTKLYHYDIREGVGEDTGTTFISSSTPSLIDGYWNIKEGEGVYAPVELSEYGIYLSSSGVPGNTIRVVYTGASNNYSWNRIDVQPGITGIAWGEITGTLSNQTDLNTALGNKADVSSLSDYVQKTTTIAGIDLQDNITVSELQTALVDSDHEFVTDVQKSSWNGKQDAITLINQLSSDLVDDMNSTNHKFVSSSEKSAWSAKQDQINSQHKLNSDYVDDTNHTNKFVTDTEKTTWNNKQNAITNSNKLNADYVNDSNSNNKFVTNTEKATWYAKLNNSNPTGTGHFSMNRKDSTSIGIFSSTLGKTNTASGDYSFSSGFTNVSSGYCSQTGGSNNTAQGNYSNAQGYNTTAKGNFQTTFGKYNITDNNNAYIEIVGNGEPGSPSDARTLDWNGNEVLLGTLTASSIIKYGGTSSQFLKADGSVDSNSYEQADNTILKQANVVNDYTSTSAVLPLSANKGKELNDRISNLEGRGRYLSTWDCTTGLAGDPPTTLPYNYKSGDFFIVSNTGSTNYKPNGSSYTGTASTTVESGSVSPNDTYIYDGSVWELVHTPLQTVTFANLAGQPTDNNNLATALNAKQNVITSSSKLSASLVSGLANVATSGSYNDLSNKPTIPTKVSQLTNDSGYITGINSSMITTALGYVPYDNTNPNGYISGITSSDVTTALGFIPYDATNPNGYTSNTGTVTSVAVKMNGATKGTVTTSGEIDLGTVITSHQDISGKADKSSTVSNVSYNSSTKKLQKTINGSTTDIVTFGSNAFNSTTIPTNTNQLTNGAGFITGITSSMVTTALGFTPYNSTNPNGYITSSSNITGSSYGVADLGNRNAILGIQWAGDWTYTDGGGIPVYASDGNLRPMQWATVKGRVGVPTFTLSGTTLTIS